MPSKKAEASPASSSRSKAKTSRASPSPATTPASASRTPVADSHIRSRIAAADHRFPPQLLSREDGIIAYVSEVDASTSVTAACARVYLSDIAMAAAGIRTNALVSVSLVSPLEGDTPLCCLAEECSRHLGLSDTKVDGMGQYFAVAYAQPSQKVLKNNVKLSWSLAITMGVPSVGMPVFISSFNAPQDASSLKNSGAIVMSNCKVLYLCRVEPKVDSSGACFSSDAACFPLGNKKTATSPSTHCPKKSVDQLSYVDESLCLDASAAKAALADEKLKELMQSYASRWLRGRHLLKGNVAAIPLSDTFFFTVRGGTVDCSDVSINVDEDLTAFIISGSTKVHLSDANVSEEHQLANRVSVIRDASSDESVLVINPDKQKLSGLHKEAEILGDYISITLYSKHDKLRYRGLLLYGPPGCGKTSLVCSCASDVGAKLFMINCHDIFIQYHGESEQALCEVFASAKKSAPALVFIDELDAISPGGKDGNDEFSIRMVATLSGLMDDIRGSDRVLVLAATSRPDCIDPALRSYGRFYNEIEIGAPSPAQRLDILNTLLTSVPHSLSSDDLQSLACSTPGFVGADLAALCNEAKFNTLRRYIIRTEESTVSNVGCPVTEKPQLKQQLDFEAQHAVRGDQVGSLSRTFSELNISLENGCSENNQDQSTSVKSTIADHEINGMDVDSDLFVTMEDFEKAKLKVRPVSMREVSLEISKVRWEDVGGQHAIKKQLIEAILTPNEVFKNLGIKRPKGLLMVGPPGCSKTLMARAVASEANHNFFAVKGPELFSKWVGDSEKAVRSLFAKAQRNSPSIIFFDEIDGLAVTRGHQEGGTSVEDRVVSQLLIEMDGLDPREGVTVIAATNRPDKIDPALLRPGRFDKILDVQPPNRDDREEILGIHMRKMSCSSDIDIKELAILTEGYTGADLRKVCRKAGEAALQESLDISEISMRHFKLGISKVSPTDWSFYENLAAKFRRFVR